ncbi:MAG: endonuclease/exonuclease/phosphatase family protein [Oscillospiraceae bacterium]
MKVVTFNIRCDVGQDGINVFDNRKGLIKDALGVHQPDIIGFQEVLPHVMDWLETNLEAYTVVGCGREADLDGEYMTLAFKKKLFSLVNLETFWLSDTPSVPGSRYEDQSVYPRICTVALLREKSTRKLIKVYVTHLDHESSYAIKAGLQLIVNKINADCDKESDTVILLGDFNAFPNSEELSPLIESGPINLTDVTKEIEFTFHNYNPDCCKDKIDYIFVSDNMHCAKAYTINDEKDGVFLSDHYPVLTELSIQ